MRRFSESQGHENCRFQVNTAPYLSLCGETPGAPELQRATRFRPAEHVRA